MVHITYRRARRWCACRVLPVISFASRLVIMPPYRMLDVGTVVWSILTCCGGMRSGSMQREVSDAYCCWTEHDKCSFAQRRLHNSREVGEEQSGDVRRSDDIRQLP